MTTPWLLLAGVLSIAAALAYGDYHGRSEERIRWQAKIEQARAEAVTAALETEREQHGRVYEAINDQYMEQRTIASRLNDELERLRNRPARGDRVPGDAATDCSGANGAELAREHAEFLTRYAARAAQQDAALTACYDYADAMQ